MPRTACLLAAVVVLALSRSVAAAEEPAIPAPPCSGPAYRAFDFWLGTWRVFDADGTHVGDNRITSQEAGCVLVENWRSARGVTGRSFNFFDAARGAWRQIWISPGSHIELEGNLVGAHMVLEGTIRYLRNGEVRPLRGTWVPLPDGGVRQYLEEGDASGKWTPWFEGFYRRVATDPTNLDKRE